MVYTLVEVIIVCFLDKCRVSGFPHNCKGYEMTKEKHSLLKIYAKRKFSKTFKIGFSSSLIKISKNQYSKCNTMCRFYLYKGFAIVNHNKFTSIYTHVHLCCFYHLPRCSRIFSFPGFLPFLLCDFVLISFSLSTFMLVKHLSHKNIF